MSGVWMVVVALTSPAEAGKEGKLVWTGIDYGLVRCVGTGDFREPTEIFPGYFDIWNGLFLTEYLEVLQKRAKVEEIELSTSHLGALHAVADPESQILRDDSFSFEEALPEQVIRDRVKGYELKATEGTAFGLVADQLHKPSQQGCFWAVTYDVASRDVLTMTRSCEDAHGIGFRNYWFGAVKDLIDALPKGGG